MNFSGKLQGLRKEKRFSQEQLAELLNVSRQSVSKWESGKAYPELDKLIRLSELFEITLDDLVKDKGIDEATNANKKSEEDDQDKYDYLVVGGFILGIAVGFITEDFIWGTVGAFLGLGVGYIIMSTKGGFKK